MSGGERCGKLRKKTKRTCVLRKNFFPPVEGGVARAERRAPVMYMYITYIYICIFFLFFFILERMSTARSYM